MNKLVFISMLPMYTDESHSSLGPLYKAQLHKGLDDGRTGGLVSIEVKGSPHNRTSEHSF